MWHTEHVAVCIVGVDLRRASANHGTTESVTLLGWLVQAELIVEIASSPVAVRRLMNELLEIADCVVMVLFAIAAHGLPIARVRQMHSELIVPGGLRLR